MLGFVPYSAQAKTPCLWLVATLEKPFLSDQTASLSFFLRSQKERPPFYKLIM